MRQHEPGGKVFTCGVCASKGTEYGTLQKSNMKVSWVTLIFSLSWAWEKWTKILKKMRSHHTLFYTNNFNTLTTQAAFMLDTGRFNCQAKTDKIQLFVRCSSLHLWIRCDSWTWLKFSTLLKHPFHGWFKHQCQCCTDQIDTLSIRLWLIQL